MENYSKMYYYLFNRITDLIEQMKVIQQEAEEMYLDMCEKTYPTNEDLSPIQSTPHLSLRKK